MREAIAVVEQGVCEERALLGALIYHKGALDKASLEITPDDMLVVPNKKLFGALLEMHAAGLSIDPITLMIFMKDRADTPVAFQSYVMGIVEDSGAAENINYYAGIIKNKSLMRTLVARAAAVSAIVDDRSLSADDKMNKIGKSIMDVIDKSLSKAAEPQTISDLLPLHISAIELRTSGDPGLIPTRFAELDKVLAGGLRTGQLVIIGGRPSMGKTTLGLNIVRHIAIDDRTPCGILSIEMGSVQLMDKLVSDIGSIEYNAIRTAQLSEDDYGRYALALSRMQDSPLVIDDQGGISIDDVERKARYMKRKHNIRVLMIDYIQMIRGAKGIVSRAEQVEDISARLKTLAKKLDICVIGLAQLNRGADKDKRPSLAQLRNSGALEQDADIVIFPYREEKDNPDTDKKGMAEIIIEKQREGETGVSIISLFDGNYARFREYSYPGHA